MEVNLNNQGKVKRVRSNATKRWTMIEERQLIEFLMENRDFEKPTAQAFYTRFLEELDWKRVRSKVRNMRVNYNTAKQWEGSTGAGSMDGDTIKSKVLMFIEFSV
ncbi:uncharacterized protein LOC118736179 [Rhagoletis pomonella]|uniref:uncharacterized protein LOC118736179 n=1 Tax=Rhagoletis pomonella TaxID=28610 RepID=UPI001785A4E4|nr:uncharacterized protein LOC118736179 [Rhagoletis pomonella]